MNDIFLTIIVIIVFFGFISIKRILGVLQELLVVNANASTSTREVEIKLLNQGSETTQIPAPKGSLDCSHTWKTVVQEVLETDDEKKLVVVRVCELCGLVDKTIERVIKERPKSECRHKWLRQDVKLPSAYQQIEDTIKRGYNSWSKKDLRESKPWFYKTTYVCTLTCELCGEVKTIVASNIDPEIENVE